MRLFSPLPLACAAAAAILAACAVETYPPAQAPEMVVIRNTPFYRIGPMQRRPDGTLSLNTRVKLLRNEMGYSLVMLPNQWTAYVAKENLAPAPPEPKPERRRRSGSRNTRAPDVPPVEVPLPVPDLNTGPAELIDPPPADESLIPDGSEPDPILEMEEAAALPEPTAEPPVEDPPQTTNGTPPTGDPSAGDTAEELPAPDGNSTP